MNTDLALAAVASAFLILAVAFVYEVWTAPLLDDDGYVIADPHGRLGPPFNQGDPVPPEHNGRRYA